MESGLLGRERVLGFVDLVMLSNGAMVYSGTG